MPEVSIPQFHHGVVKCVRLFRRTNVIKDQTPRCAVGQSALIGGIGLLGNARQLLLNALGNCFLLLLGKRLVVTP